MEKDIENAKQDPLKFFIWNILTMLDDVNEVGEPIPRKTYNVTHFKGVLKAKQELLKFHCVYAQTKIKGEEKPVQKWLPRAEFVKNQDKYIYLDEKFIEGELNFTVQAKHAIRHYYNEREELPANINEEIFEQFEKLVK